MNKDKEVNGNVTETDNEKSVNENKSTPSFVPKRNAWLLRFFKKLLPNADIRIMGDENNPAVVIDHEFILSCYVHNFDIRFTDKNQKGNILFTVKLQNDIKLIKYDEKTMNDWYSNTQHRKLNRVYLECESTQAPLYLIGWNFKNKTTKEGKYPVFGEYEPRVYFTKQKATEVQEELIQMGYNVIVI